MKTYIKQWDNIEKTNYTIYYMDGVCRVTTNLTEKEFNKDIENNVPINIIEQDYVSLYPVIDPYEGLTQDQRIAKKVSERLTAIGYSPEILGALVMNKIVGRKAHEFDNMNTLRLQLISQVYAEEGLPND